MKISIVTPAAAHARSGNRNTAARWAQLLRGLGHRVVVEREWDGTARDAMIALHAMKSHASIARFAAAFPERPLIVALTGTDLYRDIKHHASARLSLRLASRLIVLQELGENAVPASYRSKVHVVYQSAPRVKRAMRSGSAFEVLVSGHLRSEKDPFRAAAALALLPPESRIRVTHIGAALSDEYAAEARRWMQREPRYAWLGEVPQGRALRLLARSHLLVVSSLMEGGANVVSEALANNTPVVASRIAGNVGMLGPRYPGYFACGSEKALAALLRRAEQDSSFYERLERHCAARAYPTTPRREQTSLAAALSAARRAARLNALRTKAA